MNQLNRRKSSKSSSSLIKYSDKNFVLIRTDSSTSGGVECISNTKTMVAPPLVDGPTLRGRKVGSKRYEARSRGRSSPDTLAF